MAIKATEKTYNNYKIKQYKAPILKTNVSMSINKTNLMIHFIKEKILPVKNEIIDLLTLRKVNITIFIAKVLYKGKIDELYFSTYCISRKAAEYIKHINVPTKIVISDNYVTTCHGDDFLGQLKLDNKRTYVHAKVTLIKQKSNYYIITGSGNFNQNARIEQYTIRNDKKLYNFYREWMESLWTS